MRKILSFFAMSAIVLGMAFTFSACGGDSSNGGDGNNPQLHKLTITPNGATTDKIKFTVTPTDPEMYYYIGVTLNTDLVKKPKEIAQTELDQVVKTERERLDISSQILKFPSWIAVQGEQEITKSSRQPGTTYIIYACEVNDQWQLVGDVVYTTMETEQKTENALSGKFTVNNNGKQVQFSKGNLQASTTDLGNSWTWGFAANQWDFVGKKAANNTIKGNKTVSANGTVDLFGWSTASTYYGINNSTTDGDYLGSFKDWGNNIGEEGWYTLSEDEWKYLLNTRTGSTVNGKAKICMANATVNNVSGVILFPDGGTFAKSEFSAITNDYLNEAYVAYTSTTCTANQWKALETKGCVFLPAAGYRLGTDVSKVNGVGEYWSSTSEDASHAYYFFFYDTYEDYYNRRYGGRSVRLVKNAK